MKKLRNILIMLSLIGLFTACTDELVAPKGGEDDDPPIIIGQDTDADSTIIYLEGGEDDDPPIIIGRGN